MAKMNMTSGNSVQQLIRFAIPLILGNLFQLAYNTVDTLVIGRFAGKTAMAAVGTCDPIMTLMILGVSGVCVGASVLMGQFFGAGDEHKLRQELRTTLTIGMIFAAVMTLFGLLGTEWILRWMNVAEEAMPEAITYLRVIFIGLPFTVLYNIYAAALQSIGDSGTPTRYLAISSVINMVCDVVLVAGLGMGVLGAGLATVVAQSVSVVLCMAYIMRRVPILHFGGGLGLDHELAKKTLSYGGLTALQQCAQPIGNLLIQGTINGLGVTAAAAFSAARKIEDIGLIPGRSMASGITAFVAQNRGAGNVERMEKGYRQGYIMEAVIGVLVCLAVILLKAPMMAVFTKEADVRDAGVIYFAIINFCYWLPCLNNGRQGYFRGVGEMTIVLLGTLTQISLRVIATWVLVPKMGITGVGLACVVGWTAMMAWGEPCRIFIARKMRRLHKTT